MVKKTKTEIEIAEINMSIDKAYEAIHLLTSLVGKLNQEVAVVKACMKIGTGEGETEKEWVPVYTEDPDAPKKVRYTIT